RNPQFPPAVASHVSHDPLPWSDSMRRAGPAFVLLLLCLSTDLTAQTYQPLTPLPNTRAEDVTTIDSIIPALYATISGGPGVARQWDRFHTLFHPNAQMVPTRCGATKCIARFMTPREYQQRADSLLTTLGFREHELARRTDRYGAIAQAYSSYASFKHGETTPFSRGINSFQLFWDGTRWWIMSIVWDDERPDNPLPKDLEGMK
ncbi:MAG TPA: hypothetical protein VG817_11630, partial [Gemmatimonadales bacterium]|nr:hypothetical protein [Gemmatimonadales bacterium]